LQDPRSPELLLDAAEPPDQLELVMAALSAAVALDSTLPIVVVPPPGGTRGEDLAVLRQRAGRFRVADPRDLATVVGTAIATLTVNHPHGLVALLTDTPLLHFAEAPYGGLGVARRTTLDTVRNDLSMAIAAEPSPLRTAFLTRMLLFDHVWCDADAPDPNGLRGIAQSIEQRITQADRPMRRLDYRAGPVWPLATTPPDASS
jgi:hypothetical protein